MLTFISGGVRSGKSSLAEKLAVEAFKSSQTAGLYYVATAKVTSDPEMQERIRMHQNGRSSIWMTMEESYEIDRLIRELPPNSVALIDCLTVWSSNVLFSEEGNQEEMLERLNRLFRTASERNIHVILVSNDLNEEIPIRDQEVQRYVRSLEKVHQLAVSLSDTVIQVIAGCPVYWKGNA